MAPHSPVPFPPLGPRPGVSVVVPAFNAEATLGRALRSILSQDHPAAEVWVVDDGSTDATGRIAKKFGKKVRYRRQQRGGPGAARNLGIRLSRTPLLAFLDADDEWLPGKLSAQVQDLRERPAAALTATGVRDLDAEGRTLRTRSRQRAGRLWRDLIDGENFIVTSTVLLRREALTGSAEPFPRGMAFGEDYHLWLRLSARHDFYVNPGLWVNYQLPQGRDLAGKYPPATIESCYRRIASTALELGGARDKERILALMEFEMAAQWARAGRPMEAFRDLLRALGRDPFALRNPRMTGRVLKAQALAWSWGKA